MRDDWIKPGEFNFCNSCGYTVSLAVPNLCPACRGVELDDEIQYRWQSATERFRENLNIIRREAG